MFLSHIDVLSLSFSLQEERKEGRKEERKEGIKKEKKKERKTYSKGESQNCKTREHGMDRETGSSVV